MLSRMREKGKKFVLALAEEGKNSSPKRVSLLMTADVTAHFM
jgi:hypothetical protein